MMIAVLSLAGPAMASTVIQEETGYLLVGTVSATGGFEDPHGVASLAGYDGISKDRVQLDPLTAGQTYTLVAESGDGVVGDAPNLNICFQIPQTSLLECHSGPGAESGTVPAWVSEGDAHADITLQDGIDVTYRFQVTG